MTNVGKPRFAKAIAESAAPVRSSARISTTFGGSAQFAAVSVLGAGGAVAAAVLAALLLNSRYVPLEGSPSAASDSSNSIFNRIFERYAVDPAMAAQWREEIRSAPFEASTR